MAAQYVGTQSFFICREKRSIPSYFSARGEHCPRHHGKFDWSNSRWVISDISWRKVASIRCSGTQTRWRMEGWHLYHPVRRESSVWSSGTQGLLGMESWYLYRTVRTVRVQYGLRRTKPAEHGRLSVTRLERNMDTNAQTSKQADAKQDSCYQSCWSLNLLCEDYLSCLTEQDLSQRWACFNTLMWWSFMITDSWINQLLSSGFQIELHHFYEIWLGFLRNLRRILRFLNLAIFLKQKATGIKHFAMQNSNRFFVFTLGLTTNSTRLLWWFSSSTSAWWRVFAMPNLPMLADNKIGLRIQYLFPYTADRLEVHQRRECLLLL